MKLWSRSKKKTRGLLSLAVVLHSKIAKKLVSLSSFNSSFITLSISNLMGKCCLIKISILWDNIRKEFSISLSNPMVLYLNRAVIIFCFLYLTTFCFRIISDFMRRRENFRIKPLKLTNVKTCVCSRNVEVTSKTIAVSNGRRDGGRQRSCSLANAQFRQFTSFSSNKRHTRARARAHWNREGREEKWREKKENDKSLSTIWKLAAISTPILSSVLSLILHETFAFLSTSIYMIFIFNWPWKAQCDWCNFYIAVCYVRIVERANTWNIRIFKYLY